MEIELHPAYVWNCDSCGRENFERGLVPEFSMEELEEIKEEYGIDPYEEGNFIVMPDLVQCKFCKEKFKTVHY